MKILGLVPARGASKGLSGKNLRMAGNKPLLAWTVEAGLRAESLHRVILSTDDPEIARIGREYGAQVPFMRPAELAKDNTPGIAPVLHAIHWLEKEENYRPDCVMLLQPTSPLRESGDIDAAVDLLSKTDADGVVSVTRSEHHPFWTKALDEQGFMSDFIGQEKAVTSRQDLPPAYALNGAIYLARTRILLEKESWYTDRTVGYVMPPERSADIDSSYDLHVADLVLRNMHE